MSDTNEQIKQKVLEMLESIQNGTPVAQEYMATVVDQAWTAMFIEHGFGFLVCAFLTILFLAPLYMFITMYGDWKDGPLFVAVIGAIISFFTLIPCIFSAVGLIKLLFAPDLMVLQYITRML